MSEEEWMKMRLLIDGDGTGEDRRLNMLLKNILKWASSSDDSEDQVSAAENTYERILTQLAQCEWSLNKNTLVENMNKDELKNYQNLVSQIEEGIQEAKKEIRETKMELAEARQIRRNKLEYDALAKVIAQYPDRKTSEFKLQALGTELAQLRQTEGMLDEKLQLRKKQFHVLLHCITQLEDIIHGDEENNIDHEDNLVDTAENSSNEVEPSDLNTSNVSSTPEGITMETEET